MVVFRKTVVILLFVIFLLQFAGGRIEMSDETKTKINTGITEFKNVVDALEKLVSDKDMIANIKHLSGFLGVAGGLLSFILVFIPAEDSAELKYMKNKFAEVNMKLDSITQELDSVKDMITLENQRAAYIQDASKILFGYQELTKNYITEIANITSCSTAQSCLRRRLSVSERYVKTFDVKASLFSILTGTMQSTSTFGDPILDLIRKTYHCDINKVLRFANGVIKLAFQGQQVVLAHEKITGIDKSISLAMKDWTMLVYNLRKKVDEIKTYCYKNINTFMKADVQDTKYQTNMDSNKAAADTMKANLEKKYPWLYWTVISYGAYGGEKHWGFTSFYNMPSSKEKRKRVIRVISQDKGTYLNQREELADALYKKAKEEFLYSDVSTASGIYNTFTKHLQKTTAWMKLKAFVVMMGVSDFQMAVDAEHDLYHFNEVLELCTKRNPFGCVNSKRPRILASLKSEEEIAGVTCKRDCHYEGRCAILPHSSSTYCTCNPYFQGENCQEYDNINLATSVDSMLAVTAKIPKLTDIYFELSDMRDFIGTSLVRVQDSIAALDSRLQDKFDNLNAKLTSEFQWANLITHYSNSIRDLKNYLHLFQNLNSSHPRYKEKSQALASDVLGPGYAQQWARDLHFLLVGRNDISLLAHKPLLFILMDKHKGIACSSEYKEALDNSWRQLIVLQNQVYMMWAQARSILKRPSNDITARYKVKTDQQEIFMKTSTCEMSVPRSSNLECTGGFYLYPKLIVINKCMPHSYIAGRTTTSCKKRTSRCYACNCNSAGSSSTECSDFSGQCSCRNNYYGKTCHDRNCEWTSFGSYGACSKSCGYGGLKKRFRSHAITRKGKGKHCTGNSQETASCFNRCCANKSYHCGSNRKCISNKLRCNYDDDCGNSQDERNCYESCWVQYTQWNDDGRGNAVYMDRHRLSCGFSFNVLKTFNMESRDNKIRYKYTCCKLLKFIVTSRRVTNGYTYDGKGDTVYLDRQSVDCGRYGLVNEYWLSRNGNHDRWRYNYYCSDVDRKYRARLRCYKSSTSFKADGGGKSYYLSDQTISCHKRYFLQYFWLNRNHDHDKWRYTYRCCRITR